MHLNPQYQTTKPLEARKGLYAYASLPSLQDKLVEKLEAYAGMSVLDVGCGYGDRLADLVQRIPGIHAKGFDVSEAMIQAGKDRQINLKLEVCDLTTFEPTTPFDRIYSAHVLHLHPDPIAACQRMLSWLTPGGRLVLVVHSELDQPRKTAWDAWLTNQTGSVHESVKRSLTFEHDAGLAATFEAEPTLFTQTITLQTPDPYITALESHRNRWSPALNEPTWESYMTHAKREMNADIERHGTFVETTTVGFFVINKPL